MNSEGMKLFAHETSNGRIYFTTIRMMSNAQWTKLGITLLDLHLLRLPRLDNNLMCRTHGQIKHGLTIQIIACALLLVAWITEVTQVLTAIP